MAAIIQPPLERTIVVISFLSTFRDHRWSRARETREKPMAKRSRSSHFYTSGSSLRSFRCRINVSSSLFSPQQRLAILANIVIVHSRWTIIAPPRSPILAVSFFSSQNFYSLDISPAWIVLEGREKNPKVRILWKRKKKRKLKTIF